MIVMGRSCDDARAVVAIGANGVGVDEDVLDGLLSGDGGSDGEEGVHCSNTRCGCEGEEVVKLRGLEVGWFAERRG